MDTLEQLQTGQLRGRQRLQLAGELTDFPAEIFDLADTLAILDLSGNRLRHLPDDLPRLHQLQILFLSYNDFETLPAVLGQCPQLSMIGFKGNRIATVPEQALPPTTRWLILTDNQIESLPDAIGGLGHLQKLMLAGNRLQTLPETMAACTNLELVRLSANRLGELPPWLLTLPRLAWLAYGGNPFCEVQAPPAALPPVDWADLSLGSVLGEGASGVIYQGTWHAPSGPRPVAIKLFKGAVTSDGLPGDEMRACLAAGRHPHLVELLGQLQNAPDQATGLVFAVIPADYTTLGQPPSFASCSRDTYPAGTVFSAAQVLAISRGVAAAAAHLHRRGILHGDLYAHNTQVNPEGHSLLGDFGAASFYDPADAGRALALEQIEVRAFGCLLEELLDRCPEAAAPTPGESWGQLRSLQHRCLVTEPHQRPGFGEICQQLAALSL